jgi:hypothetical protein
MFRQNPFICSIFNAPLHYLPEAVELHNKEVLDGLNPVFETFKGFGFQFPVIRGGALRDAFSRCKPQDYDVVVSSQQASDPLPSIHTPLAGEFYTRWLLNKPQITNATPKWPAFTRLQFLAFELGVEGLDRPADLIIQDEPVDPALLAVKAEATMNSIAASSDHIYAHPLFSDDLQNKIYRATNNTARHAINAVRRYQSKFSPRDPDLCYRPF